jgi:hypothetical protein
MVRFGDLIHLLFHAHFGETGVIIPQVKLQCKYFFQKCFLHKAFILSKMKNIKNPALLQVWIKARKKYRLSHVQIQMARELGLNPKKFGGLANHKQEPWKVPLPEFIEELYLCW